MKKPREVIEIKDQILLLSDDYGTVELVHHEKVLQETVGTFWHGSPYKFKEFKKGVHTTSNPSVSGIWIIDSLALGGMGDHVDTSIIKPTMYELVLKKSAKVLKLPKGTHTYEGVTVWDGQPLYKGLITVSNVHGYDAVLMEDIYDGHAGTMQEYLFINNPECVRIKKRHDVVVVELPNKRLLRHRKIKKVEFQSRLFGIPRYREIKPTT